MKPIKQVLKRASGIVLKVLGIIAIIVAIFVRLGTFNGILIFFGSILVGGACFIVSSELEDDPEVNLSIWPPKSAK